MDRFHVAGWRRWANELVSEGRTLGTAGLILMLALASPPSATPPTATG